MTRAEKVIAFIRTYCFVPDGDHVGEPLVLEEFQQRFIKAVYDNPHGTRRAYLSMARKNGKTALIAALLLVHLVGPEARQNSQLVSGAMSREQASLVFNLAEKMVRMHPRLDQIVRVIPSGKRLVGLPLNTEFRALAAEGTTAHGGSPVFAVLDEVGQIRGPQSDFIDAIETSQGAHEDALLAVISTQAAADTDLFSIWLDDAAKSNDLTIVSHVYSAPKGCDLLDEEAWHAANPALGKFRSEADLRAQLSRATRMPTMESSARNLLLNQRVSREAPLLSPRVWAACGAQPKPLAGKVFGGLDLSARNDLTALVLICQIDSVWSIHPHFWTPEATLSDRAKRDQVPYDLWAKQGVLHLTPGASISYETVARDLVEITEDLDIASIGFDRWRMDVLQAELDRIGCELPLVPHGQGYKDMTPAIDILESELLNVNVLHGNHPVQVGS